MRTNEDFIHPAAAEAPGYLANHLARVFNRMVDASLRAHGLSLSLLGPILLVSWKGPMLQRDIVMASAVKQPAMVALLVKLEDKDLIVRTPAPGDSRAALVHLTDRGEAAADIGRRVLTELNAHALQGFSKGETKAAIALLGRLIGNLETLESPD